MSLSPVPLAGLCSVIVALPICMFGVAYYLEWGARVVSWSGALD